MAQNNSFVWYFQESTFKIVYSQDYCFDKRGINFKQNIVQSDYEMMTQKQIRIKNLIRNKVQKNRDSSCSFENRESGIFEMGWNDFEDVGQKEEYREEMNEIDQELHINLSEKVQLELDFYRLLNSIIANLNMESTCDEYSKDVTYENYFQEKDSLNPFLFPRAEYEETNENPKMNILNDLVINNSTEVKEYRKSIRDTLYACYACDACTQTEKNKKPEK